MTIIEPPTGLSFGFVDGYFALAVGNVTADSNRNPDFKAASGAITFRPKATKIITGAPNRFIGPQPVGGRLDDSGRVVDEQGEPQVSLIHGAYTVTLRLDGISIPPFDIVVGPEHTTESPLDLVTWAPTPTEVAVKWVVNEQVYTDTLAARDEVLALLEGFEGGAGGPHTHEQSDVVGLSAALDAKADVAAVTSALAGKAATSHTHVANDISNATTVGKALMSATDAAAARAAIGAGDGTSSVVIGTTAGTAADAGAVSAALAGKAATSHSHTIANVTSLQAALDGKSVTGHGHATSDVTGLDAALSGKAPTSHTHTTANVTGLDTALAGKADTSALAGKADTGHTHTIANVTSLQTSLDGKAATSHTHTTGQVTGLDTALSGKAATSHTHATSQVTGLDTALAAKVGSTNSTVLNIVYVTTIPDPVVNGTLYLTPKA